MYYGAAVRGRRSLLQTPVLKDNGNGLNPDSLASFNSHALIEWCWNETPAGGSYNRNGVNHRVEAKNSKEQYAFYDAMIVMFGTKGLEIASSMEWVTLVDTLESKS